MKQRIGSARWVLEAESGSLGRAWDFLLLAIITAFSRLRNANLGLAIYDEDDNQIRRVEYGSPSEEMKVLMEFEFGPDEDPEGSLGVRYAPQDSLLVRAVRRIIALNDADNAPEQVVFLGKDYQPLQTLRPGAAGFDQIRRTRDELVGAGTLTAVVHSRLLENTGMVLATVESFTNPQAPGIHVLVHAGPEWHWMPMTDQATDHWVRTWEPNGRRG